MDYGINQFNNKQYIFINYFLLIIYITPELKMTNKLVKKAKKLALKGKYNKAIHYITYI